MIATNQMDAGDSIRALLAPLLTLPLLDHIDGLELSTLSRVSSSRIAESALPNIGQIELVDSDAFRDDYSPLYLAEFEGHELEPPAAIIDRLRDEFAGKRRSVSPYRIVGIRDHDGAAIGAAQFSIFLLRAEDVVVPYLVSARVEVHAPRLTLYVWRPAIYIRSSAESGTDDVGATSHLGACSI